MRIPGDMLLESIGMGMRIGVLWCDGEILFEEEIL